MNGNRVRVRRERPSTLAWSIALAMTMLVVYTLTLSAATPEAAESAAAPRVTRELDFDALEAWCVSLGAWPSPEQARVEAAGYVNNGSAGCVWAADGAWHVLGAMYEQRKEAESVARKLRNGEIPGAEVVCLASDRVKLRVTAPESQIERIAAANDMLRDQARQLTDRARQLDRGELQPEAARSLCALAATEGAELSKKLAAMPGAKDSPLCVALTAALDRLADQLREISVTEQTAAAALSGMVRLAGIDAFIALKELQDEL